MNRSMAKLVDILLTNDNRHRVIEECVHLVDSEVASKSGLSGMAVKGAYTLVKKIKPGMIRDAVDALLDDFVERLEPFFADFREGATGAFGDFLGGRRNEAASALLGVTDVRIERAENRTIKKAYEKLRPTAMRHVEVAVPGVGRVVDGFLS